MLFCEESVSEGRKQCVVSLQLLFLSPIYGEYDLKRCNSFQPSRGTLTLRQSPCSYQAPHLSLSSLLLKIGSSGAQIVPNIIVHESIVRLPLVRCSVREVKLRRRQ